MSTGDGMVPWLVGMLHLSSDTARAWVHTGAALDSLPHLRDAFGAGVLSWDQVRPAATFVTPATDADQARHLQGCSAAQIEDLARQHKPRRKADAAEAGRRRFFRSRTDHQAGGRRYSGFLPETEAARLDAVLDRHADQAGLNETGLYDRMDARRADALVDLADTHAGCDTDPDTSLVVVQAPASVIDGHVDGNGHIEDLQVPRDSILRLLCDTKIEFSIDRPDGTTVGIGRAGRSIPRWLRRRIQHRERAHLPLPRLRAPHPPDPPPPPLEPGRSDRLAEPGRALLVPPPPRPRRRLDHRGRRRPRPHLHQPLRPTAQIQTPAAPPRRPGSSGGHQRHEPRRPTPRRLTGRLLTSGSPVAPLPAVVASGRGRSCARRP